MIHGYNPLDARANSLTQFRNTRKRSIVTALLGSVEGDLQRTGSGKPFWTVCSRGGSKAVSRLPGTSVSKKSISETSRCKSFVWAAIFISAAYGGVATRSIWIPWLDKERVQHHTLEILHRLHPPDRDVPSVQSLAIFTLGMTLWEGVGLSTIPVETAAGMVWGWPVSVVVCLLGKVLGATLAFLVGRFLLADRAGQLLMRSKTSAEVFTLLNSNRYGTSSIQTHPPLLTAFLMKFSCFPELIKNLGSSVVTNIEPWMFIVATFAHGGMFTLVWTWLGMDTAAHLKIEASEFVLASNQLSTMRAVVLWTAAILGFAVTPMVMAWWIRELRRLAKVSEDLVEKDGKAESKLIYKRLQQLVGRKRF